MNRLIPLLCLSLTAFGCVATVEPTPTPAPQPVPVPVASAGTLVLDWSINGGKDPNLCYQSNAATLEVTILTDFGGTAGTFQQSCTAFATSISLAPGRYTASALLLDGSSNPRTTAVPVNPFTLDGNDSLSIPVDFPSSSFF